MHNRFIDGFAAIKPDLVPAVDESLFPEIKGQSNTEVLFYLALTFGLERTIRRMLARAIAVDADRLPSHPKLIEDAVGLRSGHPASGRTPTRLRSGRLPGVRSHPVRPPITINLYLWPISPAGVRSAARTGCVAVQLSVRVRGLTLVPETDVRSAVWMRSIRICPTARSVFLLP